MMWIKSRSFKNIRNLTFYSRFLRSWRYKLKCWIPIILLSFFIAIVPAWAQVDVRIEVDPHDSPLVITGWLGEDTFVGNLRLTALHGDVEAFIFIASDLKIQNGDDDIDRQHVNLVEDPSLVAGDPKNFQVMVTDIKEPGTYKGEIEILLQDQTRDKALVINLTVIAKARPVLTPLPGTAQVQLRLVNCQGILKPIDIFFARRILPKSAFLDSWQLQFQNSGKANTTVLEMTTVLLGEHTGYQLTEKEVKILQGLQIILAKQIGVVSLTLNRAAIPPDHYTGSIFLTLDGLEEQLTVPVDLSVRIGPFWPGLVLFFGICLGRVFKWVQERDSTQGNNPNTPTKRSPKQVIVSTIQNIFAVSAGLSPSIRAKPDIFFWLRGFLYFCLVALLVVVGMDKLYISEGAYFGAKPFSDYLGLIFWGLSADVASRTLSNLQGGTS